MCLQTILITGASSGIGAALAEAYASSKTRLILTGRNEPRLQAIASRCQEKGSQTLIRAQDVRDTSDIAQWLSKTDSLYPITLAILNAGIGTGPYAETPERMQIIFDINVQGTLNFLLPLILLMKARKGGHIALMSSLASFKGFAGKSAYCASKAALRIMGEGLRSSLAPENIFVSVICPGFVDTPLTSYNKFPMPFIMSPHQAAEIIKHGLHRKKPRISFPKSMASLTWMLGLIPPIFHDYLMKLLPYRPQKNPLSDEKE